MRRAFQLVALVVWTIACVSLLPYAFTHHLIVCELVERVYGPDADDVTVNRIMQSLLIALWLVGVIALTAAARIQHRSRRQHVVDGQTNTKA